MSQETKTALDAALAAHIADTCGGRFVSSYVLIACADTFENDNSFYYQETSDSLPYHSALGLARYLMMSVEDDAFVGVSDDEG